MSIYERAAAVDVAAVLCRFPDAMQHRGKKFDEKAWQYTDEIVVIPPMSGNLPAGTWGDDVVRVVCALIEEVSTLKERIAELESK